MRQPFTQIYVHLVWATWDRQELLTPRVELHLFPCLIAEADDLRCKVLGVNGTEDHVHVLVRLHATVSVATLVKQLKGSSSHMMSHEHLPAFKWQGYYGAFSVSQSAVRRVLDYISNQKEHHSQGPTAPRWEQCFIEDDLS